MSIARRRNHQGSDQATTDTAGSCRTESYVSRAKNIGTRKSLDVQAPTKLQSRALVSFQELEYGG